VTKTEDEIGAETRFFYDLDLNPVGATGRLSRIQLPAVVGADGMPQQSKLLFEHNSHGQLTATVKPEGGRTELTYISGGIQDGFLSEITEEPATVGLITKFEYDAAGFPAHIQAPGGRITGFTPSVRSKKPSRLRWKVKMPKSASGSTTAVPLSV
jgi:YD repeat-containing protein